MLPAVSVTLAGMTADLDLFLLDDSCAGDACLAASTGVSEEVVSFEAAAGATYHLVVDGYADAIDAYTLTVDCRP